MEPCKKDSNLHYEGISSNIQAKWSFPKNPSPEKLDFYNRLFFTSPFANPSLPIAQPVPQPVPQPVTKTLVQEQRSISVVRTCRATTRSWSRDEENLLHDLAVNHKDENGEPDYRFMAIYFQNHSRRINHTTLKAKHEWIMRRDGIDPTRFSSPPSNLKTQKKIEKAPRSRKWTQSEKEALLLSVSNHSKFGPTNWGEVSEDMKKIERYIQPSTARDRYHAILKKIAAIKIPFAIPTYEHADLQLIEVQKFEQKPDSSPSIPFQSSTGFLAEHMQLLDPDQTDPPSIEDDFSDWDDI